MPLVVFDLDGTVSRHDTLLAYLTGFLRRNLRRVPRALLTLPAMLRFLSGTAGRGELKSALIRGVLGGCTRAEIDAWTQEYVSELLDHGVFRDALTTISAHQRSGDVLVLMSASPDLYVPQIARRLGFAESICTGVRWQGERLSGELTTPNCQGPEKARCFLALRQRYPGMRSIAYGNSASDFDHLKLAQEAWLVNPSSGLRRAAERAHIGCVSWR